MATPPEAAGATADPFRHVVRETVSDAIVDQLVRLIADGTLKPGDRLPSERDLCKRFGVGRTSVREALKPLIAMGMLEGRVGSGTFVASDQQYLQRALEWGLLLDPEGKEDLVETRHMLETNAAHWAARRAGADNLAAIAATVEGMRATLDDRERFQTYDADFHFEIARATQNQILYRLVNLIRRQVQAWIGGRLTLSPDRAGELARISLAQHEEILAALRARDADGARAAMDRHIRTASADLRALMGGAAVSSDNKGEGV